VTYRVQEASCETPKTTITESCVTLLINNVLKSETKFRETSYKFISSEITPTEFFEHTFGDIFKTNIEHSIVESTAHEKFEGEVVNSLLANECLMLLSPVPRLDYAISECQTGTMVGGSENQTIGQFNSYTKS
jgi:hypothetical protein